MSDGDAARLRDRAGRSHRAWSRADPRAALIERVAWNRWRVTLPDDAHEVTLHRDHDAYVGQCHVVEGDDRHPCPGDEYHDGPCAHLCTVRKAEFGDVTDVCGETVDVFDIEEVETARADHSVEKLLADGGRHRRWL